VLWRTSGSVLGLHRLVVGAAVDLANSGGIVGMVALGTTRRDVAAAGTVALGWRGNRGRDEASGIAALVMGARARFLRRGSLNLRFRFGCGVQGWLGVQGNLRSGVDGVGVGYLAWDLGLDLVWNLGWGLGWDLARHFGRRRLSFG
jgi:hypothetical protein